MANKSEYSAWRKTTRNSDLLQGFTYDWSTFTKQNRDRSRDYNIKSIDSKSRYKQRVGKISFMQRSILGHFRKVTSGSNTCIGVIHRGWLIRDAGPARTGVKCTPWRITLRAPFDLASWTVKRVVCPIKNNLDCLVWSAFTSKPTYKQNARWILIRDFCCLVKLHTWESKGGGWTRPSCILKIYISLLHISQEKVLFSFRERKM